MDGFFTDQSHQKSEDGDWDETRRWIDELHQLNSPFLPQEQPNRNVGPMGMSRDSLNGTIAGNNLYQSNDNRYELPLPTKESVSNAQGLPTETDLEVENASIKIQRWYRKNNTKRKQRPSIEREKPIRIPSPKV